LRARGYPVWIGRDDDRDVACFIVGMRPFNKGEDDTDEGKGC
jgi:hypothetical protein